MSNNKKRPVHFKYKTWVPHLERTDPNVHFQEIENDGLFHGFGTDLEENQNDGFQQQTVAIVEDPSGKIHMIHPTCVQFTDK